MINFPSILLVDDDAVDVKIVRRAFAEKKVDADIYEARNGREALDYLLNPESPPDERPGLVLLDLNMPVMNGLEFLEALRSEAALKSIPVVVLTSSHHDSDIESVYAHGAAGYFVKPVTYDEYLDIIGALVTYWSLSEWPGKRLL